MYYVRNQYGHHLRVLSKKIKKLFTPPRIPDPPDAFSRERKAFTPTLNAIMSELTAPSDARNPIIREVNMVICEIITSSSQVNASMSEVKAIIRELNAIIPSII